MLAISVELLHGTIRAGSADDTVLTGAHDPGDWPPSPARVFAALVAGDGTGARCRVTDGSELEVLEVAGAPRIFADDRAEVLSSDLHSRFVVVDASADGSVQEYPARKAALVRLGTRLAPRKPRVIYVWDDLEVDDATFDSLERRAARVGFLGCADSPVRMRVARFLPEDDARGSVWEPDEVGTSLVPIAFEGLVEVLDAAFEQWSGGAQVRRSWFRTERVRYRAPSERRDVETIRSTALWLRFERPLSGRLVLRVTETLKAAVLDLYTRHVAVAESDVPAVLHGHGFEGVSSYRLAEWIGLPEVGWPGARGRLHGAAIVLPPSTDPLIVEGLRAALSHLETLTMPGVFTVNVRPFGGQTRPWSANPRRWEGPARRWISAFPAVHERSRRGGPNHADMALWCEHAGFPAPIAFRSSSVPIAEGALRLSRQEMFRAGTRPGPATHLELWFGEPVRGPVVLGRCRQFGIGLMFPADDRERRE